jgi:hypothetical protein
MNNQEKFFVYRLAQQLEKTSYHFVDADFGSAVTEDAVYYGITSDPQSRLSKHRPKKGQDISLIVMAEFDNVFEGLAYEAGLVWEHVQKYGKEPKFQGMAGIGNKGYKYGGNK